MIAAPPVQLGRGYTASVRLSGIEHSYGQRHVLELRRGTQLLQRFADYDDALLLHTTDIDGDGVRDVLAVDYRGGSAGCGIWRLYAGRRLHEVYVHRGCLDTFRAQLAAAGLTTWSALGSSKDPTTDGYIHCCWLRWRRTTRRWVRGTTPIIARAIVGPPPGATDRP